MRFKTYWKVCTNKPLGGVSTFSKLEVSTLNGKVHFKIFVGEMLYLRWSQIYIESQNQKLEALQF